MPAPAERGPVHVLAPAKINLFLEVLGRRQDGYHEIETLMLAVDLCDEIALAHINDDPDSLVLTCSEPELSNGDDNLVLKAARLLKEKTGCRQGARINLEKRIPWAAGLGGGSSDAAATLAGLNELWELGLPTEELAALGAQLGSDVPFFFNTPAALCTGRGEEVKPVPVGRAFDIVLVKPPVGLGTAEVYRELGELRIAEPGAADNSSSFRNSEIAVAALRDGDVETLGRALHNRLQALAMKLCPPVAELFRRLEAIGAAGSLMSGSGSCLFALCRDQREAGRVIDGLRSGWLPGEMLATTRMFAVQSCFDSPRGKEDRHRP